MEKATVRFLADKRSRRNVLQLCVGLLAGSIRWTAKATELPGPVAFTNSPAATQMSQTRRYRARAVVTLFSIPIITKDDVGAGCAMVESVMIESEKLGKEYVTALQFSGGSWPDHLKGFNRFGMTQEQVRQQAGAVVESSYVSFMTSSPEKSSDEAWRAYNEHPRSVMLAVARGSATKAGYRSLLDRTIAPEGSSYLDCPNLMEQFRNHPPAGGMATKAEIAYPTFLHSVWLAMRGDDGPKTFMHNGKLYALRTARSSTGAQSLLTGHIIDREAQTQSEFRVWFDPRKPNDLPQKIEFRPKSFLRLVFESDPAAKGTALKPLLSQEHD